MVLNIRKLNHYKSNLQNNLIQMAIRFQAPTVPCCQTYSSLFFSSRTTNTPRCQMKSTFLFSKKTKNGKSSSPAFCPSQRLYFRRFKKTPKKFFESTKFAPFWLLCPKYFLVTTTEFEFYVNLCHIFCQPFFAESVFWNVFRSLLNMVSLC